MDSALVCYAPAIIKFGGWGIAKIQFSQWQPKMFIFILCYVVLLTLFLIILSLVLFSAPDGRE